VRKCRGSGNEGVRDRRYGRGEKLSGFNYKTWSKNGVLLCLFYTYNVLLVIIYKQKVLIKERD